MFELSIEHAAAATVSPHATREGARDELFAYLDRTGCEYQVAQGCSHHTSYTLTHPADHPVPRIVGQAVIEELARQSGSAPQLPVARG